MKKFQKCFLQKILLCLKGVEKGHTGLWLDAEDGATPRIQGVGLQGVDQAGVAALGGVVGVEGGHRGHVEACVLKETENIKFTEIKLIRNKLN